jgi:CDP-diacylglycerol--glycerol-3-phosphate 3-phosphatidyltransferase
MTRPSAWRHVPNTLSVLRIACAPALLVLALLGAERAFTWILVPALLTDAVDGWIARGLHLESRLGARLDSIGDSLLWYSALAGIVLLHPEVVTANVVPIAAVVACWIAESALAWLRYRRLSSFHTYASKVAGVLLSLYVGTLFVLGHQAWLLYVAAGASVLASLEEMLLLRWCPQWRSDVRGAWWVWRERRARRLVTP